MPLLKGKATRDAHMTSQDDEQLRHQFEQFQMFQQQHNIQAQSSSFSTTLAKKGTPISCLTPSNHILGL